MKLHTLETFYEASYDDCKAVIDNFYTAGYGAAAKNSNQWKVVNYWNHCNHENRSIVYHCFPRVQDETGVTIADDLVRHFFNWFRLGWLTYECDNRIVSQN